LKRKGKEAKKWAGSGLYIFTVCYFVIFPIVVDYIILFEQTGQTGQTAALVQTNYDLGLLLFAFSPIRYCSDTAPTPA
jgi:hypothetical protein